jgi:hypothetical protein
MLPYVSKVMMPLDLSNAAVISVASVSADLRKALKGMLIVLMGQEGNDDLRLSSICIKNN